MRYSITNYKAVSSNLNFRIDAEHYSPRFFDLLERLNSMPTITLKSHLLGSVRTGHTPPMKNPEYYKDGMIKFIKTDNLRDGFLNLAEVQMLTELGNKQIKNSELKVDDVIVTIIGATERVIARAARIRKDMGRANINQNIALIRSRLPAGFLTVFLNSKYGREQLIWLSRQTEQFNLNCKEVEEIRVFQLSDSFQNLIHQIDDMQYALLSESKAIYQQAEQTLLAELGLLNWQPHHQLSFTGNYSDAQASNRWDADYYHPKYTTILEHLNSLPHETLNNIASFSNGATPLGADYSDDGIPFLRIQNVGDNRLVLDDVVYIDEKIHKTLLKRSQLKSGDVLITITGRIGTSSVIPDDLPEANMNQHSVRLRIKNSQIKPYYLAAFLNSIAGRLQTEREAYGTTREALPYYCLERIVVPIIDMEKQNRITDTILEAQGKSKIANKLLELAKHAVEMAIEQDETVAESWLRGEAARLGVTL